MTPALTLIGWQVTNIPGNNVELGNEMFSYVPPLALQFEAGEIDKNYPAHNSPLLVFEQEDKVGRLGLGFTADTRIDNEKDVHIVHLIHPSDLHGGDRPRLQPGGAEPRAAEPRPHGPGRQVRAEAGECGPMRARPRVT